MTIWFITSPTDGVAPALNIPAMLTVRHPRLHVKPGISHFAMSSMNLSPDQPLSSTSRNTGGRQNPYPTAVSYPFKNPENLLLIQAWQGYVIRYRQ